MLVIQSKSHVDKYFISHFNISIIFSLILWVFRVVLRCPSGHIKAVSFHALVCTHVGPAIPAGHVFSGDESQNGISPLHACA